MNTMFEIISDTDSKNDGIQEYELDIDFHDDEPDFQDSDYIMDNEESDIEIHYQDDDYGMDWVIHRKVAVPSRRLITNDRHK